MSKIGKININIPEKTKVVMSGNALNIEGPLGKKTINIDTTVFDLNIDEGRAISIKPVNVTNKDNKVIGSVKPSKIIQTVFGKGKDKE